MTKFKVGDKVRVYGNALTFSTLPANYWYLRGHLGTVSSIINSEDEIEIYLVNDYTIHSNSFVVVHPMQCRLIKKKLSKSTERKNKILMERKKK